MYDFLLIVFSNSLPPLWKLHISMATQESEMSIGWPLGLEVMNIRLRVTETMQAAAPAQPYSRLQFRSHSFSSFSSSNLDTESTASFFQDNSTSLGRLIGIKPGNRNRNLYFASKMQLDEGDRERKSAMATNSQVSRTEMSQGICIPLLVGTLEKMSRNKSKLKR